jgi:hypothetical protein
MHFDLPGRPFVRELRIQFYERLDRQFYIVSRAEKQRKDKVRMLPLLPAVREHPKRVVVSVSIPIFEAGPVVFEEFVNL